MSICISETFRTISLRFFRPFYLDGGAAAVVTGEGEVTLREVVDVLMGRQKAALALIHGARDAVEAGRQMQERDIAEIAGLPARRQYWPPR